MVGHVFSQLASLTENGAYELQSQCRFSVLFPFTYLEVAGMTEIEADSKIPVP